ncbi:Glycosyl transferase family 2 [Singulisphaera sp. GP187]|uniref:glycosyltransferase n=1 Tax=Singulisphaera sp. GP187 TaxID=1882752 RepID=UPI00092B7989|nr:glycosyltransferase [Singulisphaera sp. GP187]SIO60788.1 Glycosyl transferase family 2 [Singulisphaera sp. GP187]
MSKRPVLTVIVAASDSWPAVARTVASLRNQDAIDRAEIIVAAAGDQIAPPESVEGVHWIAAAAGSGVPRLRRLGLDQARGSIAVFTEDSCRFDPNWMACWIRAFEDQAVTGASGPVEPAMGTAAVDWAVFFTEYASFLPRQTGQAGPPDRLAGNNFAVRLTGTSIDLAALARAEIQENEVHRELRQRGATVVEVREAIARHVRRYSWREAFGDRLRFGIEFGRLRAGWHSRLVNSAALVAAPAILSVQFARLAAAVVSRRRHRRFFLLSLPVTLGLLTAWSVGEALGWTWGPRRSRRSVDNGCDRADRTPAPATDHNRPPRDYRAERERV